MTISASHFVDVTTNVAAATIDRFGFGSYMHVAEHNITTNRQDGPFATLADVEDAGFTELAAPTVYFAAAAAFAVNNAVDELYIGRKIPSGGGQLDKVWQYDATGPTYVDETTDANSATQADWTLFPGTEATGDAVIIGSAAPFASLTFSSAGGTAGTDAGSLAIVWEYWNGESWAALSGVTDGTTNFTAAAAAGQVVSFTQPADWSPTILNGEDDALYYVRARLSAGSYTDNPVYTNVVVTADASWSAALSAIEAVGDEWYGMTCATRTEADILAIAAWTESRFKRYIPQSADVTYLNGTAGNVGLGLKALGYQRTMGPLYHSVSSGAANGYLDAAMASRGFGFNLDAPNGHDNWMFQTLQGIAADSLTDAQAANIWTANGNIYASSLGSSFISKGTTCAGAPYFMDIISAIDWFKRRAQEDILAHMVANRPAFDNAGIQGVVAVALRRLEIGVTVGAVSGDHPRIVEAPDVLEVSAADKQARTLTVTCYATFRGKIQKIELPANFSF